MSTAIFHCCVFLLSDSQMCLSRTDDAFKATAYLLEAARAADQSEDKKGKPAINVAFGFDEHVFEWWATPERSWRSKRMGRAMQQLHRMANENVVTGTLANSICPRKSQTLTWARRQTSTGARSTARSSMSVEESGPWSRQ